MSFITTIEKIIVSKPPADKAESSFWKALLCNWSETFRNMISILKFIVIETWIWEMSSSLNFNLNNEDELQKFLKMAQNNPDV